MVALAALTAAASLVYGVLGLRAPRTRTATGWAVTGIALAAVPAVPVLVLVIEFASGGIE